MKTAKSIIVVLFALLTAQIASAYYCPSTGRWLSRDPIGEPGFQASQIADIVPGSPQLAPSRWINRDAMEENNETSFELIRRFKTSSYTNCANLSIFLNNDTINLVDVIGLFGSSSGGGKGNGQGVCCNGITIRLMCRNLNMGIGRLGFKHCYLSLQDASGIETGTISAFANVPGHEGYTYVDFNDDKGSGGNSYPFSFNGDSCAWLKCAAQYAQTLSDENHKYKNTSDNSNTFITRIIRHCGGHANFPWGAWGSDDL